MMKKVNFIHENIEINIPDNYNHTYFSHFITRPYKEEKFRQIITYFINNNIISKNADIIDLGAWIGDNALPWAKMLTGTVHAIDPSINNCNLIKKLIEINEINNINVYQEAISDKVECIKYNSAAIDHISFTTTTGKDELTTNTLDLIFSNNNNIEFIHLDVEHMELQVVLGAKNLIDRLKPIVSFEVHLEYDKFKDELIKYFKDRNYNVYIINEILPGCLPDCRNLLALPIEKSIFSIISKDLQNLLILQ